ncbi:MAG TPA: hypothetical protein PLV68_12550, partial [Ilumatobacteraceae bacterium]|nr:hypothetical protein [Ilumatobacteraceae bacterium]
MSSVLLAINWEPQLRGILIIIISTVVLCGSIYVMIGTNIGARLGFLLSLAGLAGWMMLMGMVWWAFGLGLQGQLPSWQPMVGQTILQTPQALAETGVLGDAPALPGADLDYTAQADALDDLLVANGWTKLAESNPSFGQSASSAGVQIEEDGTLGAGRYQVVSVFDKGGERYPKIGNSIDFVAFLHKPHYIVVEVATLKEQREEPGRAPARADYAPGCCSRA